MGSCMGEIPNRKQVKEQRKHQVNQKQNKQLIGIESSGNGTNQSLKFNHSPLQSSPFLFNKFKDTAEKPEEVSLTFMITKVEFNTEENHINISYINEKQINIYVVLGGEELTSQTNLHVGIRSIKYLEKINVPAKNGRNEDTVIVVPAPMREEQIMIILEPTLNREQSMFIMDKYEFNKQEKKYKRLSQTLEWSSLVFDLQDIYGSENLFKCNMGEQCLVCLSSNANTIITPCRHMCLCKECSVTFQKSSKKCPMCRKQYRAIINYDDQHPA